MTKHEPPPDRPDVSAAEDHVLYSAAIWSGLADGVGDDEVQRTMADAFLRTRRSTP
jgi:hypothetical protein